MTFDHPHAHNFHLRHPHVSYGCRGLIYTTRSDVKSWRMLVAHDSRKQKSYRLNRPLEYENGENGLLRDNPVNDNVCCASKENSWHRFLKRGWTGGGLFCHLLIFHNTPRLLPKTVHKHYFQVLLGGQWYTGEKKNKGIKGGGGGGGANKLCYGRCANRKKQGSVASALWVDPIYLGRGGGVGLAQRS